MLEHLRASDREVSCQPFSFVCSLRIGFVFEYHSSSRSVSLDSCAVSMWSSVLSRMQGRTSFPCHVSGLFGLHRRAEAQRWLQISCGWENDRNRSQLYFVPRIHRKERFVILIIDENKPVESSFSPSGGCNHMTCRCGMEFCWLCTGLWRDHQRPDGGSECPRAAVDLQRRVLIKERAFSRQFYANSVYHRHIRTFQRQQKLRESAKRLIGTIPLEKEKKFDSTLIKTQIDKRQALLEHCYHMVKYVDNLHRICEFIAVAADGYGSQPREFINSYYVFETITLNLVQIFEDGRGYAAIDQMNQLYQRSEKNIERIRRAIRIRQLHQATTAGYVTS